MPSRHRRPGHGATSRRRRAGSTRSCRTARFAWTTSLCRDAAPSAREGTTRRSAPHFRDRGRGALRRRRADDADRAHDARAALRGADRARRRVGGRWRTRDAVSRRGLCAEARAAIRTPLTALSRAGRDVLALSDGRLIGAESSGAAPIAWLGCPGPSPVAVEKDGKTARIVAGKLRALALLAEPASAPPTCLPDGRVLSPSRERSALGGGGRARASRATRSPAGGSFRRSSTPPARA